MSFRMSPKQHYNPNPPLDRDALHAYLWSKSHQVTHRVPVHQGELAEALQVTRGTIVRVLKEMKEQGRIQAIDSKEKNIRIYRVIDPAVWSGDKKPEPKKIQWG